jgi:8-oxo-dGTP pyrophosphatase MutT (NUDIX family)
VSRWSPTEGLIADAFASLAAAPRDSPSGRFEAAAWAALLSSEGPALLTRSAAPSHLTASAVVLTPDGAATCLVLHGRMGLWVQPGGHLEDGDQTMGAAAAREVAEETGQHGRLLPGPVALSRHPAPCAPGVVDWHLDVQFALLAEPEPPTVSSESRDVAWWTIEEVRGLAAEGRLAGGVQELLAASLRLLSPRAQPTSS